MSKTMQNQAVPVSVFGVSGHIWLTVGKCDDA